MARKEQQVKYSEESAVKWKCGRTRTVASQKWSSSNSCTSQRKTKLKLPSSSSAILPPNHLLQGNWCEGGKGKGMQSTWVKVGKEEEEVHHHHRHYYSVSVSGRRCQATSHSTLSFIIKVQQRGNRLTADWLVWGDWLANFDQQFWSTCSPFNRENKILWQQKREKINARKHLQLTEWRADKATEVGDAAAAAAINRTSFHSLFLIFSFHRWFFGSGHHFTVQVLPIDCVCRHRQTLSLDPFTDLFSSAFSPLYAISYHWHRSPQVTTTTTTTAALFCLFIYLFVIWNSAKWHHCCCRFHSFSQSQSQFVMPNLEKDRRNCRFCLPYANTIRQRQQHVLTWPVNGNGNGNGGGGGGGSHCLLIKCANARNTWQRERDGVGK